MHSLCPGDHVLRAIAASYSHRHIVVSCDNSRIDVCSSCNHDLLGCNHNLIPMMVMMRVWLSHWLWGRRLIAKLNLTLNWGSRHRLWCLIGRWLIDRRSDVANRWSLIVHWRRRLHIIIICLRRILDRRRVVVRRRRNWLSLRGHRIALSWQLIIHLWVLLWNRMISSPLWVLWLPVVIRIHYEFILL